MDINKAIKTAVATGKVVFGMDRTLKALAAGSARLVITSSNCPNKHLVRINEHKNVAKHRFSGNNIELGSACGKPFAVSVLSVINAGNSDILALGKNK